MGNPRSRLVALVTPVDPEAGDGGADTWLGSPDEENLPALLDRIEAASGSVTA
jgi:hypothetical protein